MSIRREQLDLEEDMQDALTGILDERTRALVAAWALAWDQVATELEAALLEAVTAAQGGRLTAGMVRRNVRLQSAIEAVATALVTLTGEAAAGVVRDLQVAAERAATGHAALIATQLPSAAAVAATGATTGVGVSVLRANPDQVAAMVRRATGRITRDMGAMPEELASIIRSDLMRGVAVGDNPRATARRMVRRIEDRWDYSLSRAMVASRTETLDAHREAGRAVEQANADVLAGWTWVAHVDKRTCRSCIAMHGTEYPVEVPGPEDHHQGRCARVPRTKTWEELGFEGIPEPPPLMVDAEREFRRLPVEAQREILTPAGYEAWQRGEYPVEEWTRRKSNDGWRDSHVPTRPPRAA